MIRVICSKCGMPANLPDSAAGKMAQCKCGQKNPITKPAGPTQPVAPAQYSPVAAATAGPSDDLALQKLDQETGAEKDAEPIPCQACEKPLPAGEIVCRHCGFISQDGVIGKERRIISKAREVSWATKKASELTVADFLSAAISPLLFSTLIMLILRNILATLLVLGIAIGLFFSAPLYLTFLGAMPPIMSILATWGVGILIASLVFGLVVKEVFALCQATCFGYDTPRVNNWSTTRSGFLFLLLNWMPGIVGAVAGAAGGSVASTVMFLVTAFFIVPITFLSISQAGGEWSGLNPVRIFGWIQKLLVPYLGIVGLIALEVMAIAGLTALGATSVGIANVLTKDPTGTMLLNFNIAGMTAGILLVSTLLFLHPLVYMSAMLGMLYRKYENKLLG